MQRDFSFCVLRPTLLRLAPLILASVVVVPLALGQPPVGADDGADSADADGPVVEDGEGPAVDDDDAAPAPAEVDGAEPEVSEELDPWVDTGADEVPPPDTPSVESLADPLDEEPAALPASSQPPEATGETITEHRMQPDLDGLPEPGLTPEDALLWIPRILTGPLYLVTEFLIRRPVGWLVTELEQTDLLGLAAEVFTFADNKIGVFPTAFFDFGFVPSFGIYAFWSELFVEENRLTLHGGTFGPDWLSFIATDQVSFSDTTSMAARFSAIRRPDYLFGGIGSEAQTDIQSRFGMSQVDASLDFKSRIWRRSRIRAIAGYRSATFHNEGYLGNPSLGALEVSRGQALPDGFTTGYSAFRVQLEGVLDTRERSDRPNAGVAVHLFGNAHGAFEGLSPGFDGWLHWGGGLGGYTDILGDDRILALEAQAEVISILDGDQVPFFELIDVGGLGPLEGFLPGQIRGYSMLALTAAYEWPVWVFLNGRLHFTVGNAFAEDFENIDAEDLRMSFGVGLAPTLGGDLPFEIAVAFGTDTFANGSEIVSFRFVVGARNGL